MASRRRSHWKVLGAACRKTPFFWSAGTSSASRNGESQQLLLVGDLHVLLSPLGGCTVMVTGS